MGSAVGVPTQEEMNVYYEVKKAYEGLSELQKQDESELTALANMYRKGSARCARKTDDDQIHQLLALSADEKLELGKAVLQAVQQKENGLRVKMESAGDYDKSFGGTKQDTQVENEYASLVRGDHGAEPAENTFPILQTVECNNQEVKGKASKDLAKLRSAGTWLRYLGAKGCYLWIHSLTREVTALRPPDYVDENSLAEAKEEEDVTGGYPTCPLSGLPELIEKIVDQDKRTPLLIDNSEEGKVTAYLSYKAVLVDVSVLAIGYQKSGTKVSDLMETVRKRAVAAMKSGTLLALRLGHLTSEHANFKRKLCVRDVFPAEMFQEGGKKMFTPPRKPRCNLLFREGDMEQNQCIVKPDGFRFCVVTSLPPTELVEKLGDTVPLGTADIILLRTDNVFKPSRKAGESAINLVQQTACDPRSVAALQKEPRGQDKQACQREVRGTPLPRAA